MSDTKGCSQMTDMTDDDRRGLYVPISGDIEGQTDRQTDSYPYFDAYKGVIQYTREMWLRVGSPSGRPKKGPRFYAITRCTEEEGDQLGITSSGATKGKRWACKTCFGFAPPIWADGPLPDIEDIREEWADWVVKKPGLRKVHTFP